MLSLTPGGRKQFDSAPGVSPANAARPIQPCAASGIGRRTMARLNDRPSTRHGADPVIMNVRALGATATVRIPSRRLIAPPPMSWTTRRVFQDPDRNRRFLREGYEIVPLLNADDVAGLNDLYYSLGPDAGNRLNVEFTINMANSDYRRRMNQGIHQIMAAKVEALLCDYQFLGCNFVAKLPGRDAMALHQDNTIVDESDQVSVNVWCPLLDVNPANGGLTYVPQSHRWSDQRRAFGDWMERSIFADLQGLLHTPAYLRSAELPAGHALIYDARTMHGSHANATSQIRLATLSAAIPRGMNVCFHHRLDEVRVELFDADPSFYWRELFFAQRPSETPSLGVIDLPRAQPMTQAQFEELVERTRATEPA